MSVYIDKEILKDSASIRSYKFMVLPESGCRTAFIPCKVMGAIPPTGNKSDNLTAALTDLAELNLSAQDSNNIQNMIGKGHKFHMPQGKPYIRYWFGTKKFKEVFGGVEIVGVWVAVETARSEGFNRGWVLDTDFSSKTLGSGQPLEPANSGSSPYSSCDYGQKESFGIFIEDATGKMVPAFRCDIAYLTRIANTVDVDVVLDLGNTRTVALLFKHDFKGAFDYKFFRTYCKPLRLRPSAISCKYDDLNNLSDCIVNSWFMLHQLQLESYHDTSLPANKNVTKYGLTEDALLVEKNVSTEVKSSWFGWKKETIQKEIKTIRRPQMFVQLSPVQLGVDAEQMLNDMRVRDLLNQGGELQQSSPKRYYWDLRQHQPDWCMVPNSWDPVDKEAHIMPKLQSELLRFMPLDGSILDVFPPKNGSLGVPSPYPNDPTYPRSSTLTWMIYAILERAWSQANQTFGQGQNFVPHQIRNVLITHPSGWTKDEVEEYKRRCAEAVRIFTWTNLPDNATPINLCMDVDEAICSQLPIIFSELTVVQNENVGSWINLHGRVHAHNNEHNNGNTKTVRIMSLDIGGGTTDVSIVEYWEDKQEGRAGYQLGNTLLWKDGVSVAGDELLKNIIEKLVIPAMIETFTSARDLRQRLVDKFTMAPGNSQDRSIRARYIQTIFVPLGIHCLNMLSDPNISSLSPQHADITAQWEDFVKWLGYKSVHMPVDTVLRYSKDKRDKMVQDINALVDEVFGPIMDQYAGTCAEYEVDRIIISGKTSEVSRILDLAQDRITCLEPNKIQTVKDFKAGAWYPYLNKSGGIMDGKSVTAVGCALHYALKNGLIDNWHFTSCDASLVQNEWCWLQAMKSNNAQPFMKSGEKVAKIKMQLGGIIARRRNENSELEPVYQLYPLDTMDENQRKKVVTATFQRVDSNGNEGLVLESVVDDNNNPVPKVELKLWPFSDDNALFWIEGGVLIIS